LPNGAKVGTTAPRRQAILKRARPDLEMVVLRGNIETRLRKLDDGLADATILALAGLKRLGLADRATTIMSVEDFLPAVGQGAIGIETREDDERICDLVARIDHSDTSTALAAERAFLAELEGTCHTPIAGHATISGSALRFRGLIAKLDGSAAQETTVEGACKDAIAIGADAGRALKQIAGPRFFG
jgi:hydroxymethylbilane synthase